MRCPEFELLQCATQAGNLTQQFILVYEFGLRGCCSATLTSSQVGIIITTITATFPGLYVPSVSMSPLWDVPSVLSMLYGPSMCTFPLVCTSPLVCMSPPCVSSSVCNSLSCPPPRVTISPCLPPLCVSPLHVSVFSVCNSPPCVTPFSVCLSLCIFPSLYTRCKPIFPVSPLFLPRFISFSVFVSSLYVYSLPYLLVHSLLCTPLRVYPFSVCILLHVYIHL